MSERRYWAVLGTEERLVYTTVDEAIEHWLDAMPAAEFVDTVTVQEFAPVRAEISPDSVLDFVLENLDEEYGDPDGDQTERTLAMQTAEQAFINTILAEYEPWNCAPTGRTAQVAALEWVREHRPNWLKGEAP
jgi:hypothetical protein